MSSPIPVGANNHSPLPNNHSSLPVRNRRSVRLRGYDYSQAGAYFITICAQNRRCLFGSIAEGTMTLNDAGRAVAACWLQISDHFPNVELDEWVVMPNHLHGIVIIVGANDYSPIPANASHPTGTGPHHRVYGAWIQNRGDTMVSATVCPIQNLAT